MIFIKIDIYMFQRLTTSILKRPATFVTTIIHNEYNFFVDFKGLLYFDDGTPFIYPNCIKDHKFINQLYKHLQEGDSKEYPFVAEFWGERNHVRCAISPIIFHSLKDENLRFSFQQKI